MKTFLIVPHNCQLNGAVLVLMLIVKKFVWNTNAFPPSDYVVVPVGYALVLDYQHDCVSPGPPCFAALSKTLGSNLHDSEPS